MQEGIAPVNCVVVLPCKQFKAIAMHKLYKSLQAVLAAALTRHVNHIHGQVNCGHLRLIVARQNKRAATEATAHIPHPCAGLELHCRDKSSCGRYPSWADEVTSVHRFGFEDAATRILPIVRSVRIGGLGTAHGVFLI